MYVIAGPNGSGKSTFTRGGHTAFQAPIVDPDHEARLLRPEAPESAAVEAGRRVLKLCREYLAAGASFAIETTLAGITQLRLMEQAKAQGYRFEFVYIGVEDADISTARVASRVAAGGHNVPAEDIRRRYQRSLNNVPRALHLADRAVFYDNSTELGHRLVLATEHGAIVARERDLPQWVRRSLGDLPAQSPEE
jgi:predicted ABC-type ATPase